jgi:hypothetical protein
MMVMTHELTTQQAREIARLRRRHRGAEVLVHEKPWGLIVEARRRNRTLELQRFDWTGAARRDQPVLRAA